MGRQRVQARGGDKSETQAGHFPVCSWMAGLPSKDGVAGRERVMGAGPKALPVTEGLQLFLWVGGMTLAGLQERVT